MYCLLRIILLSNILLFFYSSRASGADLHTILNIKFIRTIFLSMLNPVDKILLLEAVQDDEDYYEYTQSVYQDINERLDASRLPCISRNTWLPQASYPLSHCYQEIKVNGIPQQGFVEYEPGVKFTGNNIRSMISFRSDRLSGEWSMFGELVDSSVFYLDASCTYSGFSHWGGGSVLLAPTWKDLWKHLTDYDIADLAMYCLISESAKKYLTLNQTERITLETNPCRTIEPSGEWKNIIGRIRSTFLNTLHTRWSMANRQAKQK